MLTRALLAAIVLALAVAVIAWLVRYQPFGPAGPRGSQLPDEHPAVAGWANGPSAPFARLEMATASLDGRIYLAGGLAPDGTASDLVAVFDPATGSWAEAPALPAPAHHAALVAGNGRLLLVGGYGVDGSPTDAVLSYDPAVGQWTPGPSLPEPRAAGAAAFDGGRVVYGGGVGPGGVTDDVFVLTEIGWSRIGPLNQPREHLAAASDGAGLIWFMGGRVGGLDRNLGDVDLLEGGSLRPIATITPRGGVAAFFAPGVGACLTGGETPPFALPTVECVDAAGRITALPDMRHRRHGHGVAVVDGVAYALLGGDLPGLSAMSTTERLPLVDPEAAEGSHRGPSAEAAHAPGGWCRRWELNPHELALIGV